MRFSKNLTIVAALFFGVSLTLSIERQIKLGLNFDGNLSLSLISEEDQNDNVPVIDLSTNQNQTNLTKDRTFEQNDININKANMIHRDDDGWDQTQNASLNHEQDAGSKINVGINAGSNNNNGATTEALEEATNGWEPVFDYMPASAKIFVKAQTDDNIYQKGQGYAFQEKQSFNKDLYLNKVYKVMVAQMKRRELNDKLKQIYDQLLEYEGIESNGNQ
ncbi:UNKNOWN [Stylonychia lemnae]|uniref:Uncharacterized protein n=1 Tax=Stylonychia lemnae TaxID=5949 RepID=A0A078A809_STYLE|nr:UNKNOWN [Stylonychia lemnae]|eukprot:CDW76906.1 UNKNOWN [Stylonychia lemnae]